MAMRESVKGEKFIDFLRQGIPSLADIVGLLYSEIPPDGRAEGLKIFNDMVDTAIARCDLWKLAALQAKVNGKDDQND